MIDINRINEKLWRNEERKDEKEEEGRREGKKEKEKEIYRKKS